MKKIFLEKEKVKLKLKERDFKDFDFIEHIKQGGNALDGSLKLIACLGLEVELEKILGEHDCEVNKVVDVDFSSFKKFFKPTEISIEACVLINNLVCEFEDELYNFAGVREKISLHEDIVNDNRLYFSNEGKVINELKKIGIITNEKIEKQSMYGKIYDLVYYELDVATLKSKYEEIKK